MKLSKMPTNLKPAKKTQKRIGVEVYARGAMGGVYKSAHFDVCRIRVQHGVLDLTICEDEEGNLKIHDTSVNRLCIVPCAANAIVIKASRI